MLPFMVNDSGFSTVVNGKPYVIEKSHQNYQKLLEAVRDNNADFFLKNIDFSSAVISYLDGNLQLKDDRLYYGDRQLPESISKRLIWMMKEKFPIDPLIRFIENLMKNPSKRAIEELHRWIEHKCIPITEDGCWIGYKRVYLAKDRLPGEPTDRPIYVDVHTRTVRQWIGKTVTMERNAVDDNWGIECSQGFHVGSSNYPFDGDVRLLVKVNPAHTVTVPVNQVDKCRVCEYEVYSEFEGSGLETPVYTSPNPSPDAVEDEVEDDLTDEDFE